ncbi:MAG: hypothetical protein IT308_06745 [Anaerolineaceae bacterium]|nr:hypothetical protein [Anaerolineaceae bacterium]
MLITILEGRVSKENWQQLEKNYAIAILRHPPDGLIESYLIHNLDDIGMWKIISLWKDEETFLKYKSNGIIDTCVQLFCDAGSTPNRSSHHVQQKYTRV